MWTISRMTGCHFFRFFPFALAWLPPSTIGQPQPAHGGPNSTDSLGRVFPTRKYFGETLGPAVGEVEHVRMWQEKSIAASFVSWPLGFCSHFGSGMSWEPIEV